MSTKIESNLPRPMKVTARDRAIYQSVMIDGKQQRAVAMEYKLSQPRVSAIIKRVTRWLSQGDPPGLGELYRRDRLRGVSRLHRMRLEQLYVETLEAWHKSDQPTHTLREVVVKGAVVPLKSVQTRQRDGRLGRDLHAIMKSIVAFEGFDELGQVDESCAGRVYEEPERTPVDTLREVKRRMILGGFDTPGDEGIPGMWEEEMEQRNAEVGKCKSEQAECRSEDKKSEPQKAERQLGELSLSSVLRGEGRGEGLAPREDEGRSEQAECRSEEEEITAESRANIPPITANRNEQNPTQLLSKNQPDSAQVPPQKAITNSKPTEKVLSNNPPKVPRYRLMGTAAEMAVSKSYDDFFSVEERLFRAMEKDAAARAKESHSQRQPLIPTLSPKHRDGGVGLCAPQPTPAPAPR